MSVAPAGVPAGAPAGTSAGERAPLAPLGLARLGPARRAGSALLIAASLLMHAIVVGLFIPRQVRRPGVDTPPVIEVEMVDQAAQQRGARPAPAAPQAPPPSPSPSPTPAPPPKSAVPLPADAGSSPAAPPTPPVAAIPPAPAAQPSPSTPLPPSPAAVHLGDGPEDRDPLLVTGTNVVPPRPDARIRNKPPAYPPDAARRHAQGTVGLRVHVTEQGLAAWVDVVQTSGDPSLDSAAQEAVSLWRFQPARAGGAAVPFDYALEIRFRMDDP